MKSKVKLRNIFWFDLLPSSDVRNAAIIINKLNSVLSVYIVNIIIMIVTLMQILHNIGNFILVHFILGKLMNIT